VRRYLGDPERAPHAIVAEGIENGAAVALAFKAAIEAGEVYVAAAIGASGMRAFKPCPATKRATVAADRDEGRKPGGTKRDKAGERAARDLCLSVQGTAIDAKAVALPGQPDEKIDWLDILRRDDIAAVRAGIEAAQPYTASQTGSDPSAADLPAKGSEDEFAAEFSARHADRFRYVAKWGTWLLWDGGRWKFEDTLRAFDEARAVAREFAKTANDPDIAKASVISAIERLARADRRHAATVDIWDADPWPLNTPGGIVDLRTGAILLHDPAKYMTKITAVAPGGDCPLWRKFLNEITGGNAELQAFLQRIAGYALTGSIREHALFFFYGTGGNGKGVFLNTLTAILADYATVAPMETFVVTQGECHPTDLAGLRGRRLVTSQETERGRRWAEAKIKTLTGGDPISARFMRPDFFEYTPAFKLVIAGNHKPALSGVDEAIRRRFHLVPFTVTIAEPDRELPEKLRAEWPGILAWMIEGCLSWLANGLNPPDPVTAATATYLNEEDSLAQWIEECCITGKEQWGTGALLWQSWKGWTEANKEPPGTRKAFAEAIAAHGYAKDKSQGVRGYKGIDLKPNEYGSANLD
jgi:putative DNA primase/helicase